MPAKTRQQAATAIEADGDPVEQPAPTPTPMPAPAPKVKAKSKAKAKGTGRKQSALAEAGGTDDDAPITPVDEPALAPVAQLPALSSAPPAALVPPPTSAQAAPVSTVPAATSPAPTSDPVTSETGPSTAEEPTSQATSASAPPTKNSWTLADEKNLVEYLIEHRAEGDGKGKFKIKTYRAAAVHLNRTLTVGSPKNGDTVKNKWMTGLRSAFDIVEALLQASGFTWDNETGATIDETSRSAWAEYIKAHPGAARFETKGFVHYDRMSEICEKKIKGSNVFSALHAPAAVVNSTAAVAGDSSVHISDDEEEDSEVELSAPLPTTPLPRAPSSASIVAPPAPVANHTAFSLLSTPAPPVPQSAGPSPVTGKRYRGQTAQSDALRELTGAVRSAFSGGPSGGLDASPKRRRIAIELAMKAEEDLPQASLVSLAIGLGDETKSADTYTSLYASGNAAVRRSWVELYIATKQGITYDYLN